MGVRNCARGRLLLFPDCVCLFRVERGGVLRARKRERCLSARTASRHSLRPWLLASGGALTCTGDHRQPTVRPIRTGERIPRGSAAFVPGGESALCGGAAAGVNGPPNDTLFCCSRVVLFCTAGVAAAWLSE